MGLWHTCTHVHARIYLCAYVRMCGWGNIWDRYEGGGLQRRVWLIFTPSPAHFVTDGLFAQTAASSVTANKATVAPTAEVVGGGKATAATVKWTLLTPAGASVATATAPALQVTPDKTATSSAVELTVRDPMLWSIQTPTLYTLVADLVVGGATVDQLNTTIGLRSIEWLSKEGFKLNGKNVHIRGFSHHSDFGGIGGAVPDRINLFRAMALRGVGGNTWRTSHNPYRPAVYDILDAVGVLVWDENRDFNQLNTMVHPL